MISNIPSINSLLQNIKLSNRPKLITIEKKASYKSKNLLVNYHNIIVICDDNTKDIAHRIFKDHKIYSLGKEVKADFININIVINLLTKIDLVIAVGSGTINDICKYAAFYKNIDYFIYATAPSMNGYCSMTSSLVCNETNQKKTFLTKIPTAIILDLEIIAKSPMRLIKSGLGDLLCRSSVYVDWFISSKLFGVGIFNEEFHNILKKCEIDLVNKIDSILSRDLDGLKVLCEVIIIQGILMCIDNSSNPASQSEHIIAHVYNQMCNYKVDHTHGEEVALTTFLMINLQKQILKADKLQFTPLTNDSYRNLPYLTNKIELYNRLIMNKELSNNKWCEVKSYIIDHIYSDNDQISKTFKKIGLPMKIRDLQWDSTKITKAIKEAVFFRDRYTILDLALLTGHLNKFLESYDL